MGIPFWLTVTQNPDGTYDGFDGPDYSEQPWDIITFVVDQRLLRSPGVAVVKCIPHERIDNQKPTGGDVGTIVTRGHDPAKVDIQIKIWTPSQWEILQELVAALWRKTGGSSRQDRAVHKKPAAIFANTVQERRAALEQTLPNTVTVAAPGKTLFFATPEARAAHDALVAENKALLASKKAKTTDKQATAAAAISISHPATDMFGVGAIVIEAPESIDIGTDGIGTMRIKAIQYAPPSKKNVTRKAEGAGRVAQVPEHQLSRNQSGQPPSKTDGLPALRPTPGRGGY